MSILPRTIVARHGYGPHAHATASDQAVRYSSLITWLYAGSLAGYPLTSLLVEALGVESRPFSAGFRAIFLGGALTAVYLSFKDNLRILKSSFWAFYLLFWSLYAFRLVYDTQFVDDPLGNEPAVYLLFFFGFTFLPSFAFSRLLDPETCVVALRRTIISLLAAQTGFYVLSSREVFIGIDGARLGSETLDPISFGVTGALSVAIGLYVIMTRVLEGKQSAMHLASDRTVVVLSFAAIVGGLATLFLAGSRGPVLGLVAITAILFLRGFRSTRTKLGLLTFTILIVAVIALIVIPLTLDLGAPILERFERSFRGEEMSDSIRFFLWQSGWEQFTQSPILGSGFEEKVLRYYPHNLPLEALMATGIFGGVLWLGMCLVAAIQAVRVIWRNPLYGWIPMVFILLFANSMFSGSLWGAGSLAHFMVASFAIYGMGAPPRAPANK